MLEMLKKMAKSTRISRAEYKNLAEALGNAKRNGKVAEYKSPAVVARLLLEGFLYEDGDINADWFVRERACTKGSFTKLRDRLVADNWLHFRDDTKRYFPGVRLKPHLEVVKAAKAVSFADLERKADRSELADLDARKADKSEVAQLESRKADRDEVQDLKARMNEIAEAVQKLQAASLPPDTDEKKEIRKETMNRLGQLAVKN